MRAVAVVLVCVVVSAVAGILLAAALTNLRQEAPADTLVRCWGWYEGTYAGRQGAPCPAWWPDN